MSSFVKTNFDIILGSSSPRRKEILSDLGYRFRVIKPGYEETPKPEMTPLEYVAFNAYSKGRWLCDHTDLSHEVGAILVLSADTIVVLKDLILEKPKNPNHSIEMLSQLSGQEHTVMTAFSLFYRESDQKTWDESSHVEQTGGVCHELSHNQIVEYVKTGESSDKAGSYGIQGMGELLVKEIKGSLSNVIGLPKEAVSSAIEKITSTN
jgi:septum formation protein